MPASAWVHAPHPVREGPLREAVANLPGVQQLVRDGSGVVPGGAAVVPQPVLLEHEDVTVGALGQAQRRCRPDGAGADDDVAAAVRHVVLRGVGR